MNIQQRKLAIIQQITHCDDAELLQIIFQLLERSSKKGSANSISQDNQQLLDVLLQGSTNPKNSALSGSQDLQDLQDSIDEVFGKD